ncbi:MAG: MBL fold metallo-hydrolase [Desulfamplus sp.]|nr:MBL fold metallo-hydrolase [Desulfamplus sp.]
MDKNRLAEKIQWLGHDCMRIDADSVIYFDPYEIDPGINASIILITHDHYDHCSIEDVKKILGQDTVIVTEKDSAKKLEKQLGKAFEGKIEVVAPGQSITVKGIVIDAVPSYNINKKFHPKNKNWLGFVVSVPSSQLTESGTEQLAKSGTEQLEDSGTKGDVIKFYHAGDTDLIPEMSQIKCDVAFLPVSGTYVMTAKEAVLAALEIMPRLAIPMHYGALVGTEEDAQIFQKALEGKIETLILRKGS